MDANKEIRRLAFAYLIAFLLVAIAATYWAVSGRNTISQREDNPRLVEREARIRRGAIYDRHQTLLAQTSVTDDLLQRQYLYEAAYSATGYFSFRYGTSSIEDAYNTYLRGDHLPQDFARFVDVELLHNPQTGADIELTLDLVVQQRLFELFGSRSGSGIAFSIPDGGILSMISLPTYNPNTLDQDWESLIAAPGNPFFNRALQGRYQPGGILQTPLMAASLLTHQPFDVVTADANIPVTINDVTIECGMTPPQTDLTLSQAYTYACPRPFSFLARQIDTEILQNLLATFRLNTPPVVIGFPETGETQVIPAELVSDDIVTDILGQGSLTVNPLAMATLTASIINQGNAPQPNLLAAIRNPGEDWSAIESRNTSIALMTADTARKLRELMAQNMQSGVASPAYRPNLIMGAHAALAYSGEQTHTWFIGYVLTENLQQGAAVAIVVEDSDDVAYISYMGGEILDIIHEQIASESQP